MLVQLLNMKRLEEEGESRLGNLLFWIHFNCIHELFWITILYEYKYIACIYGTHAAYIDT